MHVILCFRKYILNGFTDRSNAMCMQRNIHFQSCTTERWKCIWFSYVCTTDSKNQLCKLTSSLQEILFKLYQNGEVVYMRMLLRTELPSPYLNRGRYFCINPKTCIVTSAHNELCCAALKVVVIFQSCGLNALAEMNLVAIMSCHVKGNTTPV